MIEEKPGGGGRCAMCGAPVVHRYRPFCSRRCADLDLGRWLDGSYAVPVVELDESDLDELESGLEDEDDEASSR